MPFFENLYMVKRELKHGKRVYCMEYHFRKSAKGERKLRAYAPQQVILLLFSETTFLLNISVLSYKYLSVGKYSYWDDDTHSTQLSFGVDEFLVRFDSLAAYDTDTWMLTTQHDFVDILVNCCSHCTSLYYIK